MSNRRPGHDVLVWYSPVLTREVETNKDLQFDFLVKYEFYLTGLRFHPVIET